MIITAAILDTLTDAVTMRIPKPYNSKILILRSEKL